MMIKILLIPIWALGLSAIAFFLPQQVRRKQQQYSQEQEYYSAYCFGVFCVFFAEAAVYRKCRQAKNHQVVNHEEKDVKQNVKVLLDC